jgi:hypothetical protein
MPENPNIKPDQTPVNLDEIEPEQAPQGDADNGDVECPDSPSGQHEFDADPEDPERETCVYCGQEKGE